MKWILGIIVIAAAAGALWWSGLIQPWIFPQAPVEETSQAQAPTQNTSGLPTAENDSSDDALLKDSAAIDAELQAFGDDSASVDQSLNDKPVQQSY